jgi:dTDP-4-dehydrorhamnose 3,5-epimerase-like enzyme
MKCKSIYPNGDVAWELSQHSGIIEQTGDLGVIELGKDFNFNVKRVFFLSNIAKNEERGFHSHKELKQLILCLNGSFTITLDVGSQRDEIKMRADNNYLFLDGRVWREMRGFSEDAVMLVLCDREYRFDKVVRDYGKFKKNLISMSYVKI